MPEPPRPTIRCLHEDLAETVTDPRQRSALRAGQLPDLSLPLHDIAHVIVAAARDRYMAGEPRGRDRFRSVRDHPWVECRHGERWRGLVLWHPCEQKWLGFAGFHESGSVDDVYARFTRACMFGKRTDSSAFLPDDDDLARLEGEIRHRRRLEAKLAFTQTVIRCLLDAVDSPELEHPVSLFDGSQLRVTLRSLGDLDDLTLRISVDWRGGAGAPIVEDVKDAVPGIAPTEWDVIPPRAGADPTVFVYVDAAWVARLRAAAAQHGIDALGADPNLVLDPADGAAHIVPGQSAVSAAYVQGQVVRTLCGKRFVPSADPDTAAPCPACVGVKADLQRVLEGDS